MPKTKRKEDASMSVEQGEMPPAPAQPTSAASPPTGYRISILSLRTSSPTFSTEAPNVVPT